MSSSTSPHPSADAVVRSSRTSARPSRRRTWVIAGGAAVAAAALTCGGLAATGAFFTSQATVAGQQVSTATVEIAAGTAASSSPIDVPSLLPGDTASTTIDLANTGSEGVYYAIRLPRTAGGASGLESALQVTTTVGSATETRSLSSWQDGALQIGPALAAGAHQTVTVTVALPSTVGDTQQGVDMQDRSTGFTVQVDAIQARNTTAPTGGWIAD